MGNVWPIWVWKLCGESFGLYKIVRPWPLEVFGAKLNKWSHLFTLGSTIDISKVIFNFLFLFNFLRKVDVPPTAPNYLDELARLVFLHASSPNTLSHPTWNIWFRVQLTPLELFCPSSSSFHSHLRENLSHIFRFLTDNYNIEEGWDFIVKLIGNMNDN